LLKFFIAVVCASLLFIAALHIAIAHYALQFPSFSYQTILFLALTTSIIFRYLYNIEKPEIFVQLYLLMMAVKLLGYGAYVFYMIMADSAGAVNNVALFLLFYVTLTAMEIIFLYAKIQKTK